MKFSTSSPKVRARVQTCALVLLATFTLTAAADTPIDQQSLNKNAPPETIQYGRLVGNWKIRDFGLDAEGNWQESNGADWNFFWILGGAAIQDNWISPGLDKPEPESGRQYGTNIRIYNPALEKWQMSWVSNTGRKMDTFEAVAKDDTLVMNGTFNGSPSRITFYNITENSFSWKLEQQTAGTEVWREVYLIEATRTESGQ